MAEQEQVASPPIDLTWLDLPTKWGIRSKIDSHRGLTLESINDGPYGEVPETAREQPNKNYFPGRRVDLGGRFQYFSS